MDVDYMNSSQETAQADLVAIMMEMEKLHELSQFPGSPSLVAYYNAGGVSASSSPSLLGGAHAASFCNGQEQYMAPAGMRSTSPTASELSFGESSGGKPQASVAAMREMIFRIAAMQPIHIDPESVKPPKRRNVRISKDPQSVAARHRRERISERIRILQRLVPGGTKMDTASMLEEAIHYMKFLKDQVQTLEQAASSNQQHFSGNSMTTSASSTEAGYAPDVNRLSVGNYCEAMWDQGFDMNNTTPTTTHMFY